MNKNAALFIVAGIIALAALFLLFKPKQETLPAPDISVSSAESLASASSAAPTALPIAQVHEFEWRIEHGKKVSGPDVVQVKQGENVTLKLTSDHADEMHLHGYDLEATLKAGETAVLSFQAVHSGHFDLELHHAHLELGALEVLPE